MKNKISKIPFTETSEQSALLEECIKNNKTNKGAVMTVLQEAQGIYGYLPIEVMKRLSSGISVPLERIYGVATFYAQFTLEPKGKYTISVCMGTACYVKGAGDILKDISTKIGLAPEQTSADGKFSLTACRCIGACGLAPVLTINEEVYGRLGRNDIDGMLDKYIKDGDLA